MRQQAGGGEGEANGGGRGESERTIGNGAFTERGAAGGGRGGGGGRKGKWQGIYQCVKRRSGGDRGREATEEGRERKRRQLGKYPDGRARAAAREQRQAGSRSIEGVRPRIEGRWREGRGPGGGRGMPTYRSTDRSRRDGGGGSCHRVPSIHPSLLVRSFDGPFVLSF